MYRSSYYRVFSRLGDVPAWAWGIVGFFVIIVLVVGILYLLTLQNALKAVSPQNRRMRPGQVWLLFIPLFSSIYLYFVVKNISESLEAEYRTRGINAEPHPTYNIGLAHFVLAICSWIPIPFLKGFIGFTSFICWIIYWVKVGEHKNRLQSTMGMTAQPNSIF